MNGTYTGYSDRKGRPIFEGDRAISWDSRGRKWPGVIVKTFHKGKIDGKPITWQWVFRSRNMESWLHQGWAGMSLEVKARAVRKLIPFAVRKLIPLRKETA